MTPEQKRDITQSIESRLSELQFMDQEDYAKVPKGQEIIKLWKKLYWLKQSNAGYCIYCEQKIPVDHIKTHLTSRLCIHCHNEYEKEF